MLKRIGIGFAILLLIVAALLFAVSQDWFGRLEVDGQMAAIPRPVESIEDGAARQDAVRSDDLPDKQILFGDFHVHTTFSFDAFMGNLPMAGGAGSRPPSDACDFARYCSALDFWSTNDHAENLTQDLWTQTVDSVRRCNEAAGDPQNPDLVTFLGWEWSQIGTTPEDHYGHKNVVLLETADDKVPTRPIGSQGALGQAITPSSPALTAARVALLATNGRRGLDFGRLLANVINTPPCPEGVPVRDLPPDCLEAAETPELLFEKLNDWGFPTIVIPHGTAWGMYTPAGSDWRKQLPGHDPNLQTLIEVYSGHGNSEQLPPWREIDIDADGVATCPEPSHGYLPSCWRAGQLIEERCRAVGEDEATCQQRAVEARQNYVDAHQGGTRTLPGFQPNDWLDSGQAPDMFQPAFNLRPRSTAQYILAIRDFSDPEDPKRFKLGFLGSSDTHTASAGSGYKEVARGEMTDGRGMGPDGAPGSSLFGGGADTERTAESVPFVSQGESPLELFEIERGSAYMVTGGLVAVHSEGRDRQAIWDALQRKEVYATSGRRTLLWFELLTPDGTVPMGSTTRQGTTPRFRVRAAGSFEQKPGCPDYALEALGPERMAAICRNECYNPSETRRPISRIEIVRIKPQNSADEPVNDLVEDPWKTFPCPADGNGCVVEFDDPEFGQAGRDAVYYARAIETPAELIHGNNPLRCRYDENGDCVEIDPCGATAPREEDCLGEAEPRAWSSPIYIDYQAPTPALPG